MVAEGTVGYNVGKLAVDIIKKAEFNKEKAETCVIFFDDVIQSVAEYAATSELALGQYSKC